MLRLISDLSILSSFLHTCPTRSCLLIRAMMRTIASNLLILKLRYQADNAMRRRLAVGGHWVTGQLGLLRTGSLGYESLLSVQGLLRHRQAFRGPKKGLCLETVRRRALIRRKTPS